MGQSLGARGRRENTQKLASRKEQGEAIEAREDDARRRRECSPWYGVMATQPTYYQMLVDVLYCERGWMGQELEAARGGCRSPDKNVRGFEFFLSGLPDLAFGARHLVPKRENAGRAGAAAPTSASIPGLLHPPSSPKPNQPIVDGE